MAQTRNIHLVGSVPLDDADAVFTELGRRLGTRCQRYPDGETGERSNWTQWQAHVFKDHPALTSVTMAGPTNTRARFALRDDAHPDSLIFPPLRYASVAAASFERFRALRANERVPPGTRFQVSLPTPVAIAYSFAQPAACPVIAAAIERRMQIELAELLAAIPHADLAIQWDCAFEPIVLAGGMPDLTGNMRGHFLRETPALIDRIPVDVPIGVHLCYGDPGHKHIIEPDSLALSVDLAQTLTAATKRRIDWFHMPVPRDRDDDTYVAPLADLALPEDTELYLGLVHMTDGVEGGRRRIATAERHRRDFGIATECGFGRRDPATIPALLDLHALLAD
jgi:hypothetical protein